MMLVLINLGNSAQRRGNRFFHFAGMAVFPGDELNSHQSGHSKCRDWEDALKVPKFTQFQEPATVTSYESMPLITMLASTRRVSIVTRDGSMLI
jgi:hypothetical protein